MVEGMSGPAARARELVQGDVGPEPGRVVQREGVANGEPEGGGSDVPCVTRYMAPSVGVLVRGDGGDPEGVVGAVRGVEESVLVLMLHLDHSHGSFGSDKLEGWHCDWNLVPVIVLGFCHVKQGQHRCCHDEERRIDKVPPGAYSSACTKCQRDYGIITEVTILVQKTIGLECFWLGI